MPRQLTLGLNKTSVELKACFVNITEMRGISLNKTSVELKGS